MTLHVRHAVIPAAGRGSRLYPTTLGVLKPLLPAGGRPVIHLAVDEGVQCGLETIVVVVPEGHSIERYFRNFAKFHPGSPVADLVHAGGLKFVIQESPRGLGDAIISARSSLPNDVDFAVILPDVVPRNGPEALAQLLSQHTPGTGNATVALRRLGADNPRDHGCALTTTDDHERIRITAVYEKPVHQLPAEPKVIAGRYVLPGRCVDRLVYDRTAGTELDLTPALAWLASRDELRGVLTAGEWLDTGRPSTYLAAQLVLAMDGHGLTEQDRAEFLRELETHGLSLRVHTVDDRSA